MKDQSIRPAIQALKDRLDLEQQYVEALKRHHRLAVLNQLTSHAPPLENPPAAIPLAPDSLALAFALLDRPEHAQIREKLAPEHRDLHEMGYLVAECRWNQTHVDHTDTLRVWNLARKWNVEEWVTGRAPGSPLEPGETIDRLVRNNAKEIDELFLKHTVPLSKGDPLSPKRHSQEIADSVARELKPCFDEIKNEISEFAEAATSDRTAEPRPESSRLISPNEAAKLFAVSANTLRREYHAGRIEGRRVGSHLRLLESSVREWCHGSLPKPTSSNAAKKPPRLI